MADTPGWPEWEHASDGKWYHPGVLSGAGWVERNGVWHPPGATRRRWSRRKRWTVGITIALLLFVVFPAGVGVYLAVCPHFGSRTVPDVVGDDLSQANERMCWAGFSDVTAVDDEGRPVSIQNDDLIVISQQPPAGRQPAHNRPIRLRAVPEHRVRESDPPSESDSSSESDLSTNPDGGPFGGDDPEDQLMPDLICMDLQSAQDEIQDHGVVLSGSTDATGQGRSQLIDSGWVVVDQFPDPGVPIGELDAELYVVKFGEEDESILGHSC